MSFAVATAYIDDYQWFDDYEEVSVTYRNPNGGTISPVPALRYPITQTQIDTSDLGIEPYDVEFWFWASVLDAATDSWHSQCSCGQPACATMTEEIDYATNYLKNGDKVTDTNGYDYTILSLTKRAYEPRWRAICRQQM
jgi:hypothetical protein